MLSLSGKGIVSVLLLFGLAGLAGADQLGLDYPHNSSEIIACNSCHYIQGATNFTWVNHIPQDLDDTLCNKMCWSCHDGIQRSYLLTHSSLTSSTRYGEWSMECRVCHWPHHQSQARTHRTASYVATGVSTAVAANTLSMTGAGWTENAFAGYILIPDTSSAKISYQYKILSNTADTLTISGSIDLVVRVAEKTFGIFYGKLIKSTIKTPNSGNKDVKLFRPTGANSFADGDDTRDGVCEVCHTQPAHFRNDGTGPDQGHSNIDGGQAGNNCLQCHLHTSGFGHGGVGGGGDGSGCSGAAGCHQDQKAHPTHMMGGMLSGVGCLTCHEEDNFPRFTDGQELADTTVCGNCHSANGVALAKQYFAHPGSNSASAGSWAVVEGEKSYCGSCHDATPANSKADGTGDSAPNILGNDTTYGFYVTGHGKASGNYTRLSHQASGDSGNPAANRQCADCHDLTSAHFNNAGKRLVAANNQANANCNSCHATGGSATANPQFYTTSAAYENSAHGGKLCTDCHDIHGATTYAGMTRADKQNLCTQCHSNGGHPGVGTAAFTANGQNYTLQCTSCHNVHLVTGTYSQANLDKSPVTRFTDNTNVWGDVVAEKMNAYAGVGTYRTPIGESFTGAQLPDYATFCTDCHGQSGSAPFGINWTGDPHGKSSANQPNGYGTCPNWFACGKAKGWDGDDCVGSQAECWPVTTNGKGDQLYSRNAYNHEDRIAGANFTLSCTDCHTGHGSGTLGRSNVNGGSFSGSWNSMCNNCHYYYSDWHAGMGCGSASCHVSNSIHRADNMSGSSGTRTFNPDLVLHYAFENTLKDSGGWEMDAKWYTTAGTFTTGKVGQAAVFGEDIGVQAGTENAYWSTDEGYHGTWKYTEMKYNSTLEAWVYPTDSAKSEYTIFTKHVGINSGGYVFSLKKNGGTLRASFNMQTDNNGFAQGGAAGIRGAYSAVAIPLNKWTHVAATFETGGPDRNPSDPAVGRIRIYVNGEDVTTSDSSGNNLQPGVGETSIYAYSENSPWNQAICYNGTWCASEFAVGGFDWEATNFIGRIDEAKVWNVTKNADYFATYDSQAGPYISKVEGLIGSNQLAVTFSEGVYTNSSCTGALTAADFVLTDTNGDNPRTITGISHTAGSTAATLTMSQTLKVTDIGVDLLAAASNAIYDDNSLAAGTETVTIGLSSQCPSSPITLQLNETAGSSYVMDTQGILYGAVYGGASTLTSSAYSGGGDGSGRYIDFEYNTSCLQADRKMTIEVRLKPTGISGTTNYIRRILARDSNGNFQLSLWRNDSVSAQDPPSGVAMVAFWVKPVDPNPYPGTVWKGVLTDFNTCRIVNDHWYLVKTVWDSDIANGIPVKIYMDDQGTDGSGTGENWAGYIDCTDSDQSEMPADKWVKQGDELPKASEAFTIGTNLANHTSNLFNGLIDWVTWQDAVSP